MNKKKHVMANTRNTDWKETLKKANEQLATKAQIIVTEEDGLYQVDIKTEETVENFASGYYECELSECILEALYKAKQDRVDRLVEEYLSMSDSQKDEFLRRIEG